MLGESKYLFETENLGFRRFDRTDAERLYEHHNEQGLKAWLPNESYENLEEAIDAVEFFGKYYDNDELPFVLAIELKETHELIGDTGVNEAPGGVEIGYSICEKYQRHGYATETVKAMTEFLLIHFNIKELFGRVMHGNGASCRVMDKSGYKYIKEEFGAEDDPYGKGMLIYKLKL